MSEFFYLAIIIIMSPTEVQLIQNKVSVTEYKAYKVGIVEKRKSFPNSMASLQLIEKANDKFAENEHVSSLFIDLSPKGQGGELQKLTSMGAKVYTQADIEAFAKERNQTQITDALLAEFAQEKAIEHVPRKR